METKARYGARVHRVIGRDVDRLLIELVAEQGRLTDELARARTRLDEAIDGECDPADVVVTAHVRLAEIERTSRAIIASLREVAAAAADTGSLPAAS